MKQQYQMPATEVWRLDAEDAVLTSVSQQTQTAESYGEAEEYDGF